MDNDKLTEKQKQDLDMLELPFKLLEATLLGNGEESGVLLSNDAAKEAVNSALCASIKREENLQYQFMVLYQALIAILAVAALGLLLFAIWQLANDQVIVALTSGLGTLLSAGGSIFLVNQRKDAREAYKTAQAGLAKNNC